MSSSQSLGGSAPRVRAAQYIRMSTDRQIYSLEAQAAAIAVYAVKRDIDVVRTYSDEGRSGVTIHRREGLQQLIQDVQSGRADFSLVLVYDVSRWGRFQDIDESAYYEFVCKLAGIGVAYCAEQFENDGSLVSMILKALKRMAAAEFSRELSAKVQDAQRRTVAKGFKVGGYPKFGLRRFLVDQNRRPKFELRPGERKSLQSDKVILVPGPKPEVDAIRYMFQEFGEGRQNTKLIAASLNHQGVIPPTQPLWNPRLVRLILKNPKYAGHIVFNMTSRPLGKRGGHVKKSPEEWVYTRNAFEPVVSQEAFDKAQERLKLAIWRIPTEQIMQQLRSVIAEHGELSAKIIKADGRVSLTTLRTRLGGVAGAYKALGYSPKRDPVYVETRHRLHAHKKQLVNEVFDGLGSVGAAPRILSRRDQSMLVNGQTVLGVVVSRMRFGKSGKFWRAHFETHREVDFALVRLIDRSMEVIVADYLFSVRTREFEKHFCDATMGELESHRLSSLDVLYAMFAADESAET